MAHRLDALADWVRRHPALLRGARGAVRLIPDVAWTRRFDGIGAIRFRLRQQRWYLWEPFAKHDHFMLGVFHRLVRPDDVVYDIGANIGIYTRMLAQWFGASRVLAFEPMAQNVALLRANVSLGGLEDRVEIFPMALSDRDGEEQLQIDDVRSTTAVLDSVSGGAPSAGRQHFGLPGRTTTVEVARLDTLVRERGLPAPNVLKIDTEGAEALVIDGATSLLREHQPRLTIATHGPEPARATLERLTDLGYGSFGFVRTGDGPVYRRLVPGDATHLENNNILSSVTESELQEPLEPKTPDQCRGG